MIKTAIAGAAGRMGKSLIRCMSQFDNMKLCAAIEAHGHDDIGQDAGTLAGSTAAGITVNAELNQLADADVLIDFSFHSAVPEHLSACVEHKTAIVIGTTGLNEDELNAVQNAAKSTAVLHAPNMSVGMNLLFAMVKDAAGRLPDDYDIEITEMHHRHKKDAPSGTALRIAECAAEGRNIRLQEKACYGRHGIGDERPRGEIGIHTLRGGDIVGDHTVLFSADGEQVIIGHRATNRDVFTMGALRAAQWIAGKPAGAYTMRDVLGL